MDRASSGCRAHFKAISSGTSLATLTGHRRSDRGNSRECWGSQIGEAKGAPQFRGALLSVQSRGVRIDLNADVGESFGPYSSGHDAGLFQSITSANVAAGFHAGDPSVLRATIRAARAAGISIGAHPGFADRLGFGRHEIRMGASALEDLVIYQIAAVAGVAAAEGAPVHHVKPHGALYNMAARDREIAGAIVRAVAAIDRRLLVYAPPHSVLESVATDAGLAVIAEAFVDRAYQPDGALVSRQSPGAVLHDLEETSRRAVRLVTEGIVTAIDGSVLRLQAQTLCIHSDTDGADRLAARVRVDLEAAGVAVRPPDTAQSRSG